MAPVTIANDMKTGTIEMKTGTIEMKNKSGEKAKRGAAGMLVGFRNRARSFGKNGPSKKARSKKACRRGDPRKAGI